MCPGFDWENSFFTHFMYKEVLPKWLHGLVRLKFIWEKTEIFFGIFELKRSCWSTQESNVGHFQCKYQVWQRVNVTGLTLTLSKTQLNQNTKEKNSRNNKRPVIKSFQRWEHARAHKDWQLIEYITSITLNQFNPKLNWIPSVLQPTLISDHTFTYAER